jgi:hypothetical protein
MAALGVLIVDDNLLFLEAAREELRPEVVLGSSSPTAPSRNTSAAFSPS